MSNPGTPNERDLFLRALGIPPGERADFLRGACGSNTALYQQVLDLLRGEEGIGKFLEAPAATVPSQARGDLGPTGTEVIGGGMDRAGDRIGRYKLLENIGEGGCGVVYMAEQEEPVRRRVALKVIKLGMDTKSVIARFEAERQALAMMDHPNIAKFYDAGVTGEGTVDSGSLARRETSATSSGRPYFVMELVRGVRITEYCDRNKLPTAERLELFAQVCHAIHHAHQKGIIHRDIKPSNILVTLHDGRPVPKVIDFGIAKATEQRLTDKTLFTQFTTFIGTPAYMSPEQAEMSGLDVDTRSDIYSMGVLLYELLTGKTPFDAETLLSRGLDECRRTIREDEPLRPSTRLAGMIESELTTAAHDRRVESTRLIHQLQGDLDWVAMKCLEKDRTRRYASANDLALDVRRYLDTEPVEARPPSTLYRMQKLLHRHRAVFTAAAAVVAVLIAGAVVSTWQAVRATRAELEARRAQTTEATLRQKAELETARAERERGFARLNEYVADINLAQQALTSGGNLGRARRLLGKHEPGPGQPDLRGWEWRYLWQLCDGDEHASLPTQSNAVLSLAFARDGRWLAVGRFNELRIYDIATRTLITNIAKGAISMIPTPDGRSLIAASPSTVRVWDTTGWSEQKALANNSGPLTLSSNGARLTTYQRNQFVIWDTATWQVVHAEPGAIPPMALSSDGHYVVAGQAAADGLSIYPVEGRGQPMYLTDSTNLSYRFSRIFSFRPRDDGGPSEGGGRSITRQFGFGGGAPGQLGGHAVLFSPDGRYVLASRNSLSPWGVYVLSIWNTRTGEHQVMPKDPDHIEHTGEISAMAFSPSGDVLATASVDHSIRLWDINARQRIQTLQGHVNEVRAIAFSADGQTLASGADDGSVRLWPLRRAAKEDVIGGKWQPVAFSRDSRLLAALNDDYALVFLNVATGEAERQFAIPRRSSRFGGPAGLPALAISPDFQTIAFGASSNTVQFIHTHSQETNSMPSPDGNIESLLLSADGQTLVTLAGRARRVRVWDLAAGTNAVLPAEALRVLMSPDERFLVAVTRSNLLQIWDMKTLSLRAASPAEQAIGDMAFSGDSRYLAFAGHDDVVWIYDVPGNRMLGTCTGHKQRVSSVAFAPDGLTLVSVSDDSTLKFWNVATQQELLTIRRLGGNVRELLFSPDGRVLVGSRGLLSRTSGLRFYRAPTIADIEQVRRVPGD